MSLISILLITVSILTILSGIVVFFGSSRSYRPKSAWFLIATVLAVVWMMSIMMFLNAPTNVGDIVHVYIKTTYLSGMFIDVALLGYISWHRKYGKTITVLFLLLGVFLSGIFLSSPDLLYTDVMLSNNGNALVSNFGPFYIAYAAFYGLLVPTIMVTLLKLIFKSSSKNHRGAEIVLLIGFGISGTLSLIFNLILPLFMNWQYVWIGPVTISATIIAFYYAILRYRSLNVSSIWLKILSYIVIMTSAAVIYMVIFFLIFAAMFRGSTPSSAVIILNFIMIMIVLLLSPALREVNAFVWSLISPQKIDMVYMIKKLSNLAPNGVDLKELASFLASHMHFEYIGFLIDDQVYGSAKREFSDTGLSMVAKLGEPEKGVWQEFDEQSDVWQKLDLSAIAALRNTNGKTFGQVMVGRPYGKSSFHGSDLIQVETIINLVAIIIDSKLHSKGKSKRS